MKLTDRDTKIINFITNQGATIEQLQELFFPSYSMTAKRLKLLEDNKFLKSCIHPVLGKKVYYIKKIPSFHSLIISEIAIILNDKIKFMQREYKIKNNQVDCIFILKTGKIIILEVDIFNKTKDKKVDEVLAALSNINSDNELWIVTKHERREKEKSVKYIKIENIKKELSHTLYNTIVS